MSQGDPRPRHLRHTSKIVRTGAPNTQRADARLQSHEDETVIYIKKVLCTSARGHDSVKGEQLATSDPRPLEELLPPLTSSNNIDVELYAIIAVVLNQFVHSWYSRITSDSDFIDGIVQIIAHCTRGVEQRLRHVDLEGLLLDELPALLVAHIESMSGFCRLQ